MIERASYERKIAGNNVLWIIPLVLAVFLVVAGNGGELINWGTFGFEVLIPFFVTIMVCEWVKTLSDPLIEVLIVHTRSLFRWIAGRFLVVFGITSTFCIACMVIWSIIIPDASIGEYLIIYFGTTFFLSSLGVLASFLSRQPHITTAVCGTVWFLSLMFRAAFMENLIKIPDIGYIYPFVRFAAPESPSWIVSKAVLFLLGMGMWAAIYFICRQRRLRF